MGNGEAASFRKTFLKLLEGQGVPGGSLRLLAEGLQIVWSIHFPLPCSPSGFPSHVEEALFLVEPLPWGREAGAQVGFLY